MPGSRASALDRNEGVLRSGDTFQHQRNSICVLDQFHCPPVKSRLGIPAGRYARHNRAGTRRRRGHRSQLCVEHCFATDDIAQYARSECERVDGETIAIECRLGLSPAQKGVLGLVGQALPSLPCWRSCHWYRSSRLDLSGLRSSQARVRTAAPPIDITDMKRGGYPGGPSDMNLQQMLGIPSISSISSRRIVIAAVRHDLTAGSGF